MKIKATTEVEFEMERGQPEKAANSALARGRTELHRTIEHGITSMPAADEERPETSTLYR